MTHGWCWCTLALHHTCYGQRAGPLLRACTGCSGACGMSTQTTLWLSNFLSANSQAQWSSSRMAHLVNQFNLSIWLYLVSYSIFLFGSRLAKVFYDQFRDYQVVLKVLVLSVKRIMKFTWKSWAWFWSWAGLSGPTGLKPDQNWILESKGLGVRSRPDGV